MRENKVSEILELILSWIYNVALLAATVYFMYEIRKWWVILFLLFIQVPGYYKNQKNKEKERELEQRERELKYETKFN